MKKISGFCKFSNSVFSEKGSTTKSRQYIEESKSQISSKEFDNNRGKLDFFKCKISKLVIHFQNLMQGNREETIQLERKLNFLENS